MPIDSNLTPEEMAFFSSGELPSSMEAEATAAATAAAETEAARLRDAGLAHEIAPEAPATELPKELQAETPPTPAPVDTSAYDALIAEQRRIAADLQAKIEALTKKQEEPEIVPDQSTDPLGYLLYQNKKTQEMLANFTTKQQESALASAQENAQRAVMQAVVDQVKAFEVTHTDYQDAYKHLVTSRGNELTAMGYNKNQIAEIIGGEHGALIENARAAGKVVPQVVYDLAKMRGYTAKTPVVVADDKLETIKKGLEAAKGVEPSGTPSGKTTAANLRNASLKELQSAADTQWDEMFGKSKDIF